MCKVNIAAIDKTITPHRNRCPGDEIRQLCGLISYYLLFTEEIRGGDVASNCLTWDSKRRYLYYITNFEDSNEKAAEGRSENARVETGRHPQHPPRLSFRHSLQGESILRSQRSPSGSLRDAAPARRGGGLDVAAKFGVSRPTVYQAHAAFLEGGLSGLLPQHRGPKEGHKLSTEVIEYVRTLRAVEPKLTTTACVQAVQEKFSITIHRRSLERALTSKKKPRNPS